MTLDQQINLGNMIGTWVAGIATLSAVLVSLHLARRSERLRLKVTAGLRLIIAGDGSPAEEHVEIRVVNLGDRVVTVNTVGWRVGKRKEARFCIQPVSGTWTQDYPKQLAHGETGSFLVSFKATPNWMSNFAHGFLRDLSESSLSTLRVQVHTSLGQTIDAVPEKDLIGKLRAAAA